MNLTSLLALISPLTLVSEHGRLLQTPVEVPSDFDQVCMNDWNNQYTALLNGNTDLCLYKEILEELGISDPNEEVEVCVFYDAYFSALTSCLDISCRLEVCDNFAFIESSLNSILVNEGLGPCSVSCGYLTTVGLISVSLGGVVGGIAMVFLGYKYYKCAKASAKASEMTAIKVNP